MSDQSLRQPEDGDVWMVGIQLDPDGGRVGGRPELYTLLLEKKGERPVVHAGRVVLFTMPELAAMALQLEDDAEARGSRSAPDQVSAVYQVGRALSLIRDPGATEDDGGVIVDCLNLLFDCVAAIGLALPAEYRGRLHALADHLTFSTSLTEFEQVTVAWRDPAHNGVLWCLGAIAANCTVLNSAALSAIRMGEPPAAN